MHLSQTGFPGLESFSVRIGACLVLALLVNVLLLMLILQLVSASRYVAKELKDIQFVEFVRLEKDPAPPQRKSPEQKLDKEDKPPELLEIESMSPTRPAPQKLELPSFKPVIPAGITSGPYLGDFPVTPRVPSYDAGNPTLQIPPTYPSRARRAGIEGSVWVEFTIDREGAVKDPKIIKAEPTKMFDRAVLRAIRRWKFNPKTVDGETVEYRARREIVFKLKSG